MSAFSRQIGRNSLWVSSHDKIMVAHRLMVGGKLQSSHEPAILKPPPTWMPARRADNTGRPSQPFQVVKTISIRQEPSLKFPKRLWVVNTGARTSHPLSLRPTPVKWIPQSPVFRSGEPHWHIFIRLGNRCHSAGRVSSWVFWPCSYRRSASL